MSKIQYTSTPAFNKIKIISFWQKRGICQYIYLVSRKKVKHIEFKRRRISAGITTAINYIVSPDVVCILLGILKLYFTVLKMHYHVVSGKDWWLCSLTKKQRSNFIILLLEFRKIIRMHIILYKLKRRNVKMYRGFNNETEFNYRITHTTILYILL